LYEIRGTRRWRASKSLLATLHCPTCGASYGSAAAHDAFNPPPPPPHVREDDFGFAYVVCPACRDAAYYERSSHILSTNRDLATRDWPRAIGLPDRSAAAAHRFLEKTHCSRCGNAYGAEVARPSLPFPYFFVCPFCREPACYHNNCTLRSGCDS